MPSSVLDLGVGAELAPGDEVGRQLELGVAEQRLRGLQARLLAQRRAHVVALGLEEREAHRAADQDRVGLLEERLEHADLVRHLRAADDRHQRALRVLEDAVEGRDLALEQAPRRGRQQVRDALGGGVRPVGGAERVVDVDVGELRVALGQRGVVLGLALEKAHVLDHHDVALGHVVEVGREHHVDAEQLAEAVRRGLERELLVTPLRAGPGGRAARARSPPSPATPSGSAAPPGFARRR